MTTASWLVHPSRAVFQSNARRFARVISPSCMSAANGNGWFGKLAVTWQKVPRGLLSMHNSKRKQLRPSSGRRAMSEAEAPYEMANLTLAHDRSANGRLGLAANPAARVSRRRDN